MTAPKTVRQINDDPISPKATSIRKSKKSSSIKAPIPMSTLLHEMPSLMCDLSAYLDTLDQWKFQSHKIPQYTEMQQSLKDKIITLNTKFNVVILSTKTDTLLVQQLKQLEGLLRRSVPKSLEYLVWKKNVVVGLLSHFVAIAQTLKEYQVYIQPLRYSSVTRSIFHVSTAVCVVAGYHWILQPTFSTQTVAVSAACLCWVAEVVKYKSPRFMQFMVSVLGSTARLHEFAQINSATWYTTALGTLSVAFPTGPYAMLGVMVLGVGDPSAAYFGKKYGRVKFKNGKSVEGLCAFIITSLLATMLYLTVLDGTDFISRRHVALALTASLSGGIAELVSYHIDDNVTIPLVAATVAILIAASVQNFIPQNRIPSVTFERSLEIFRFIQAEMHSKNSVQPVGDDNTTSDITTSGTPPSTSRRVYVNDRNANDVQSFRGNAVSTTKYSFWTFLPLNLFQQFRRLVNVYFFGLSVLTAMPFSPKDPFSLIGTFVFVLSVSALKEAYEDYLRHKSDEEVNHRKVSVLRKGDFESIKWLDVKVGDILSLNKDVSIPVDCILLSSSDTVSGICYVDTCNLDGETNLKPLVALPETAQMCADLEGLMNLKGTLECEQPHADLYAFNGSMTLLSGQGKGTVLGLSPNQLLLRGCTVRNTKVAYAIAVYTGRDTKAMLNANDAPFKVSAMSVAMNRYLYFIFILQGVLCLINTIGGIIWIETRSEPFFRESETGLGFELESFLTFIIAYSNLIPISLYVGIEVMKLTQRFLIDNDQNMYHEETDRAARCRTSNLVEELGQVEVIFSDKTGTLTCNQMDFICCTIGFESYGFQQPYRTDARCSPHASEKFRFQNDTSWKIIQGEMQVADNVRRSHEAFWTCLALCHTVVAEILDDNDIQYQATSPDENALVTAAKEMGFMFVARTPTSATMRRNGVELTYDILHILEFDSTRKRMSVILRDKTTGRIQIFCKGADSIIMALLAADMNSDLLDYTNAQLKLFSQEGLRTLCLAFRDISKTEYAKWNQEMKVASALMDGREAAVDVLAAKVERDLIYIGSTAIEDKLQGGVPEAIDTLLKAGMKIVVLTGDKEETAINIGISCKLLHPKKPMHSLSAVKSIEEMDKYLRKYLQQNTTDSSLVIDGTALVLALSPICRLSFLKLMMNCKACICCRISPKQKAEVVLLVRENLNVITLAIGDGANDVSMIQAAHIGIGISGYEGMQAVNSSDYSIAQFRFLQRLLLVHGYWGYRRLSDFILFYFYKNMASVLTEFWFAWSSGYSGQIYFADWLSLAYNAVYTSFACIAVFALDQAVPAWAMTQYPLLYSSGPRCEYFNAKKFVYTILLSIYHSAVIFYVPLMAYNPGSGYLDGQIGSHWSTGTVSFTCVILVVNLHMFLQVHKITEVGKNFTLMSILIYFVTVVILQHPHVASIFQPEMAGIFSRLVQSPMLLMTMILVCFLSILPEIVLSYIQRNFYPQPADIIFELSLTKSPSKLHPILPKEVL